MDKFERICAWYEAGGRLKLPLKLKREFKLMGFGRSVYEITPVFLPKQIDLEVWEWFAWVMAGLVGYRLEDVGRCAEYGWSVDMELLELEDVVVDLENGNCFTFLITVLGKAGRERLEQGFSATIAVPYGANAIESFDYETLEEVRYVETMFERCKRKFEITLNQLLSKLLKKVANLRDKYRAGWRLQFPLRFVVESTKVAARVRGMLRIDSDVCSWLGADVSVNRREIDVEISKCRARVSVVSDEGRYGLRFSFVAADIAETIAVNIYHNGLLEIRGGKVACKDEEKAQAIAVMFSYLKRELEERLNALLEKMLYG
jgi:hypothetical protein